MRLRFCVICGTNKNLQFHHIKPKSRGGDDHQHNILTLCRDHHAMIHQVRPSDWNNVKTLQKEGMERAMRQGKVKGRGPVIDTCLLYTSPSPRDGRISRMPSSA